MILMQSSLKKQLGKQAQCFPTYLAAWNFCQKSGVHFSRIDRYDWRTWVVKYPKKRKVNNVRVKANDAVQTSYDGGRSTRGSV